MTDFHEFILNEARQIYLQRDNERTGVWRRSGAKGMAMHVMAKAERIWIAALREDLVQVEAEAPDIINYSVFTLEQARAQNWNGEWPWPRRME